MSEKSDPLMRDGWQCWIYIYENYVIKLVKNYDETKASVLEAFRGKNKKGKSAEEESKRVLEDIRRSKAIINRSNFPLRLMDYPEFYLKEK